MERPTEFNPGDKVYLGSVKTLGLIHEVTIVMKHDSVSGFDMHLVEFENGEIYPIATAGICATIKEAKAFNEYAVNALKQMSN